MADIFPGSMEFDSSDAPYSILNWTDELGPLNELSTLPSISSLCPKMDVPSSSVSIPEEIPAVSIKTETPVLNQLLGFSTAATQDSPVLDFISPVTCIPEVPFGDQFSHDMNQYFSEQYFSEQHEHMLLGSVDEQGTVWSPMDAFELDNGQLFLASHQDWYPSSFPLEMPAQDYVVPSPMYSLSDGSDYQVRTPPLESSLSHHSHVSGYSGEEVVDIWSGRKSAAGRSGVDDGEPTVVKNSQIQLWEFLKQLLGMPQYHGIIRWMKREEGIFRIEDSGAVSKLWGLRKSRPAMNYDKLSRSIRQYYRKGIMQKTKKSTRLVYQFCEKYRD